MAILNENLQFKDLTTEEQASFNKAPAPQRMLLPKGTRLYKWTSYPLYGKDRKNPGQVRVTPFWSSKDGLDLSGGQRVPSFEQLRKRYRNINGGVGAPRDWARARSAVTKEWNTMDAILFMQLDQPVWAFVGVAAAQPFKQESDYEKEQIKLGKTAAVRWIGGDWQIVIPNMNETHCHQIG